MTLTPQFFVDLFFMVFALGLTGYSGFSIKLMNYTSNDPERLAASRGPTEYIAPELGFSILLPMRHEPVVAEGTIREILEGHYPHRLMELIPICSSDDHETIAAIRRAISGLGAAGKCIRLVIYELDPPGGPSIRPSKTAALNCGLKFCTKPIVTIFDAEDGVDRDLFNLVNTIMKNPTVDVVQSGVQLMNHMDTWFALHNCLEYFFHFKSRLHYHAMVGFMPLGGNTAFFRREILEVVGGWDDEHLTEDAALGLRISLLERKIMVVYDSTRVTKEEVPVDTGAFIRQRTRWNQGFARLFFDGEWLRLKGWRRTALAAYTFGAPLTLACMTITWPMAVASVFWLHLPIPVSIVSFLPLGALIFQLLQTLVGARSFCKEYSLPAPISMYAMAAVTFVPFQLMLEGAALRALWRNFRQQNNWEKTKHVGAHRVAMPVASHDWIGQSAVAPALALASSAADMTISGVHVLQHLLHSVEAATGALLLRGDNGTYDLAANQGLTLSDAHSIRLELMERAGQSEPLVFKPPLSIVGAGDEAGAHDHSLTIILPVHDEQGDNYGILFARCESPEAAKALQSASVHLVRESDKVHARVRHFSG